MKKIIAIALGVLALAACSREAQPAKTGSREVKFTTSLNTYVVKATSLEGNVQIFAGAPINAASDATVNPDANTLTPTTKIYWQDGQTDNTTFGAYYPAPDTQEGVSSAFTYGLVTDTGYNDYDYHNNFLVAFAKDVAPETAVSLDFAHPFAKLVVEIDNQREDEISSVVIEGVPGEVAFDFTAGTAAATDTRVNVNPNKVGDSYVAVIAPASAQPVIKVTVGNDNFIFALGAAVEFEANKVYTAELTIAPASVTPQPTEGEEVTFGFTVADWAEAESPLNYTDVTDTWYVSGCVYTGATAPAAAWGEDIEMTKGADGKYSVTVTYDEALAGDDESGKGFLIHKIGYIQKYGTWSDSPRVNLAWDNYGLDGENGVNILLCTVTGEAPDDVWTPFQGEVTITFNPEDGKLSWDID